MVDPQNNISTALAVGGIAAAVVGWFVTLERRLSSRLTRKEHQDICERNNKALDTRLDKIEDMLEDQNQLSSMHREQITDKMARVQQNVAVIRERLREKGDVDPLAESGLHASGGG